MTNKLSLISFCLGILALINIVIILSGATLNFLGSFNLIVFYLPALGIMAGLFSFMSKPKKKDLIFSVLGIIFSLALYIYFFYLVVQLAKSLGSF